MTGLVLHDYWRSSASYRVRIALNLKEVDYRVAAVNLLDGEQGGDANRAVNPQGFVPSLVVDGVALTQSLAIIEWLDATYPAPPLLSSDPTARARQTARALVVAADIHPLNNLRVLKRLKAQFGAEQEAIDDWYRHWIVEGLGALEALAAGGAGPFLGGDAPDISDVCLVPQLYNARRFDVALEAFPTLLAADAAAAALPAFADALPERVKP